MTSYLEKLQANQIHFPKTYERFLYNLFYLADSLKDEEEIIRFCADGILGVVDTEHVSRSEETKQAGRSELLQRNEGNVLQLGYDEDIRTR